MRTVTCRTEDCGNKDIDLEVPDIGTMVVCGVCGAKLADEEPDKLEEYERRLAAGEIT